MKRLMGGALVALVASLTFAAVVSANPGQPFFGSAIFADGQTFGTKGAAAIPEPNDQNAQSFDVLFQFANGVMGQHAVAEAAPGNPDFNGGRWIVKTATWVSGTPTLLTSYADVMAEVTAGNIVITDGALMGPDYLECPLLPDKS